jgi:uncharacterized protein YbaP (TraB family)
MRAAQAGVLALALLCLGAPGRAAALHCLWELHGKHNTVFLMGSIHVLRPGDYPLAAPMQDAYAKAASLVMEVDLGELDSGDVQSEMLGGATLPEGKTLVDILGAQRHARAVELAQGIGVDLSLFDRFAPWFAAEAITQLQLATLGFDPQAGVEMYFLGKAQTDHKTVDGLETVHDQIALFEAMSWDAQADYLVESLEQARDLPTQVSEMVSAWQHGDVAWFDTQLRQELGHDPGLYQSLLASRNRRWVPKIEALLNQSQNYLVIVGTGHLVGRDSVIDLLRKDGIAAVQR